MPSINSCRVIFPSWSLSMRRKKSMTRDFLWFIQRMYFFRQTSKSKFANSFNWKGTRGSQQEKPPQEQHPNPPARKGLSGLIQTTLVNEGTWRNRRTHSAADSHRHGMQHPPGWDKHGEISATRTWTHTHPLSLLGLLGTLPRPGFHLTTRQGLPGMNPHRWHHFGDKSSLSLSP